MTFFVVQNERKSVPDNRKLTRVVDPRKKWRVWVVVQLLLLLQPTATTYYNLLQQPTTATYYNNLLQLLRKRMGGQGRGRPEGIWRRHPWGRRILIIMSC